MAAMRCCHHLHLNAYVICNVIIHRSMHTLLTDTADLGVSMDYTACRSMIWYTVHLIIHCIITMQTQLQVTTTHTVSLLACSCCQEAASFPSVLQRAQLRLRAAAHQHAAVPVTRSVNLLYGWAAATCGASARHATWHAARHTACATTCACNRQQHVTGWSWCLSKYLLRSASSLELLAAPHSKNVDSAGCNC